MPGHASARPDPPRAAHAGVPDAVAPPPRHPRFPLIDGTRAIAVLAVVVVHSAVAGEATGSSLSGRLLAHLNVGVAIFFVISGFLLYRPFIAHRSGGARAPAVGEYGKRRALRIFPAYWLALLVLTVLPGLTGVYGGHWLPQVCPPQKPAPCPPPHPTPSPHPTAPRSRKRAGSRRRGAWSLRRPSTCSCPPSPLPPSASTEAWASVPGPPSRCWCWPAWRSPLSPSRSQTFRDGPSTGSAAPPSATASGSRWGWDLRRSPRRPPPPAPVPPPWPRPWGPIGAAGCRGLAQRGSTSCWPCTCHPPLTSSRGAISSSPMWRSA